MHRCVRIGAVAVAGAVPVEQGSMLQTKRPAADASAMISPASVAVLLQQGHSVADIAEQVATVAQQTPSEWDTFLEEFRTALLGSVMEAHNIDQALLNAMAQTQANCETERETTQDLMDERYGGFTTGVNEHNQCRTEEASAEASAATSCTAYDDWLDSKNDAPSCLAQMERDSAVAILQSRIDELNSWIATATNFQTGCDEYSDEVTNKTMECALVQKGIEGDYCFWHVLSHTQSTTYEACRDAIDGDLAGNITEIEQRVIDRKAYYMQFEMILCILEKIFDYLEDQDNVPEPDYNTLSTTCEAEVADTDTSFLDLVYPAELPRAEFDLPTTEPGDEEWSTTWLNGGDATTDGCSV